MADAERDIEVKGKGNFGDLERDLDKAGSKLGGLSDIGNKITGAFGSTLPVIGGVGAALTGVVAIGEDFVKAAAEDQAEAAKLAKTLENVTGATKDQIDAVENWIDKTQRATGVADSQIRPAFEILARQTTNVTDAQKLMGIAMDVSAGTGKDLSLVSTALSKILEGNTGAASKLVPELAGMAKEGASANDIMAELARTFEGQTAAKAKTAEGAMSRLNIMWDEAKEKIGYKLLPLLTEFGTWLADVGVPKIEQLASDLDDWWTKQDGLHLAIKITVDAAKDFVSALQKIAEWGKAAYDQIKPLADAIERVTGFNPTKITTPGHALADATSGIGNVGAGGNAGASTTGKMMTAGFAGSSLPVVLNIDGRQMASALVELDRRYG